MHIVLLDAYLSDNDGQDEWPELATIGSCDRYNRSHGDAIVSRLHGANIAITNKAIIDEQVIAACADLRHVAITATGTNVVNVDACRRAGIAVSNVPAYSTQSVTQHVFALILHQAIDVGGHARAVAVGTWSASPDFSFLTQPTWELAGKRLAIIGYGDIGQAVARIAKAFGLIVDIVQLPWRPPQPGRRPLNEALAQADIVSLHCPLTPETEQLVNADFLQHCRDSLLLINTGRGALIDEPALASWLQAHPRARAGLDVLASEPPPADNPLLSHPQVTITPHIAWATHEARRRLRHEVMQNIVAWMNGQVRNRVD